MIENQERTSYGNMVLEEILENFISEAEHIDENLAKSESIFIQMLDCVYDNANVECHKRLNFDTYKLHCETEEDDKSNIEIIRKARKNMEELLCINNSQERIKITNKEIWDDPEIQWLNIHEALLYCDYLDPISNHSIFNKSFIFLMTVFEATVFDIVSNLMTDHFFEFIRKNKKELGGISYSLKYIADFTSLEKLREGIINNILEGNRIFKLLKMLEHFDETLFIVNDENSFYKISELVARRNIHMHKRGIVDEEYFRKSHNIFGLSVGKKAYINRNYFNIAYDLLSGFISNFFEERIEAPF